MNEKIKKNSFSMILYIFGKRKFVFLLVAGLTLLTIFLDFLSPQIIRIAIDSVIDDKPFPAFIRNFAENLGGRTYFTENLNILIFVFIGMVLIQCLLGIARRFYGMEISEFVSLKFRNTLYMHIQSLPYSWHVKNQTGDIIQRSTSDVDTLRNFLSNDVMELMRCFFIIIISLSLMVSMDKQMTLISIVLLPVIVAFGIIFRSRIATSFKVADEAEGQLQATVQENFTGMRIVRAFGREMFEMKKFDGKNMNYVEKSLVVSRSMALYWGLGDIIAGLQITLVMIFGIYRCVSGGMTLGTFTTFYTYSSMMIWPLRGLGRIITNFSKATVSAKRIHEVLVETPEDMSVKEDANLSFSDIEFKNVSFTYVTDSVLKNLSFKINKGETLGILGGTGSGKSTIACLLTRLYDLGGGNSGEILINGVNINNIPKAVLRKKISLILQEPFLYSKTIKENITAPDLSASESELHAVSRTADIHDAILKFTDGYGTVIGERGVTLSGGQKQRVAIARMLMQKAPVMIFDDSLSAVDTETDQRIRKSLAKHTSDSIVILISHRISTLMRADKIMVLKDGVIENFGTHNELKTREGIYKRVYDIQAGFLADNLEESEESDGMDVTDVTENLD